MNSLENQIRSEMQKYCQLMYERSLCVAGEGNISCRVSPREILITPTGENLGSLVENDFVVLDMEGNQVRKSSKLPSSEFKLHLEIYKNRADVDAIVHFHSRNALLYAITHKTLPWKTHPEVVAFLGEIPTIPYARPSSDDLAKITADSLGDGKYAGLMANHGAITLANDLKTAYWRAEVLDAFAYVCCFSEILGKPIPIPDDDIALIKVK